MSVMAAGLLLLSPGGSEGKGFQDGRTVGVRLTNSRIVITGTKRGGKSDGYRIKRPCWYEPDKNAADMLKYQELPASSRRYMPRAVQEKYEQFIKQFKDKVGKEGRWWTPAYNAADPDGLSCWADLESFVWVPLKTTPPSGITVKELTQVARAALTVPKPRIRLNPGTGSYVNLPTWVWLDRAGAASRSVTAEIPGVMSVTLTARLNDLKIDSGAAAGRAEVREKCGPGGKPYAKGAGDDAFACGVRYLRASADQPRGVYPLRVTAVWTVTARGARVGAYEPVRASATREVPVGEVQSTVKGGR